MVIANRFLLFLVFLVKKGSADVDAWFGIGQGYKPYPTNDASACWKQLHIYKPYFHDFLH